MNINAHTHIFDSQCAPKDFLKVGLNIGDNTAALLEGFLQNKIGQGVVNALYGASSRIGKHNNLISRYTEFLKIGTMATQKDIFEFNEQTYDSNFLAGIKFVVLTLDMDYMSDSKNKPVADFESQIDEVKRLKQYYPDRVFPFLGVDPRNPRNLDFNNNVQSLLESKTFSGIKLYPSHGFFPFDPRLDQLYSYAQQNNIPIMTHCTRSGSFFIGNNVWSLIPDAPEAINAGYSMDGIYNRIQLYKHATDKLFKQNARICNLFLHPENYLPVLYKYPKLKLCLAHLGGEYEVLGSLNNNKQEKALFEKIYALEAATKTWYQWIKEILKTYDNAYSDISYTLSSGQAMQTVYNDLTSGDLPKEKVLFGTDYFLVEQEGQEMDIVANAKKILQGEFQTLLSNGKNYLFQ